MIIHMNTSIVKLNIENQFVHPDPPVGGSELIFAAPFMDWGKQGKSIHDLDENGDNLQ